MAIEIRLPNITGVSEKEQLLQLKSYLYQLSEQLQWAFDNINTTGGTGNGYVVNQPRAYTSNSSGMSGSNAQIPFAEIKALIIKSADIVDAYYEGVVERLNGQYFAQSDFGTFIEQTNLTLEKNSKSITQNYTDTQTIINNTLPALAEDIGAAETRAQGYTDGVLQSAKDEINGSIQDVSGSVSTVDQLRIAAEAALQGSLEALGKDVDAFGKIITDEGEAVVIGVSGQIKTGVLYYTEGANPIPVIGIEVGQQVTDSNGDTLFRKYARFTSERLSFYDANGNEVAYISDKKLYIGQAEITTSLKVGGLVDYVMANGDVVTKWEGVSG